MKYFLIFLTFMLMDCSDVKDTVTQDVERQTLNELAEEIKAIADSSVCSEGFTCDFIGFGNKPCGGHWTYLVYSTSIDVADFIVKVKAYNELEEVYNKKWGVVSDCMLVLPPDDTVCKDGKCIALYN